MSFYALLGQLENRTMLDTLTREAVGINTPRIALTRSQDERIDVMTNQIGNSVAAFGGGALLNKLLDKLFAKTAQAAQPGNMAANWARLGRSGAIYASLMSLMWAMPYVRNYLTAKRTGQVDFTNIIGAGQKKQDDGKAELRKALKGYTKQIATILSLGAVGTVVAILGSRLAIARKAGLGMLQGLFRHKTLTDNLLLKGGSFNDLSGVKAMLFWALPSYAGYIQGARDTTERNEQFLKLGIFTGSFLGPDMLLTRFFKRKFSQLLPQGVEATYQGITEALAKFKDPIVQQSLNKAFGFWKFQKLGGLLISIALLGALPPVASILMTKHRLAEQRKKAHAAHRFGGRLIPAGNLRDRTFAQWQAALSDRGHLNGKASG